MKKYITERTHGQYKTTEINWSSSKHYTLLYAYSDVEDALEYINDLAAIASHVKKNNINKLL